MDRYIPRPVNRANLYCCAILISCRYHLYRLSRPPSRSLTPNGHAPLGRATVSLRTAIDIVPPGVVASGASALPKIMSLTSFATLFSGSALTRIFHETPAASADTAESAPESAKFNPRRTASTTPVEFCVFPRIFSGLHTLATKFHEISGLGRASSHGGGVTGRSIVPSDPGSACWQLLNKTGKSGLGGTIGEEGTSTEGTPI